MDLAALLALSATRWLLYFLGVAFVGFIAYKRHRRPFVWALLAVVLSPPIAFIVVLIMGRGTGGT